MDPKISVDYWKVCGFVFFGAVNFLVAVNKDPSLPSGKIDMCQGCVSAWAAYYYQYFVIYDRTSDCIKWTQWTKFATVELI